ncbi:MAG TPA: DUF2279 domain-containing protein [Longimicrobiaceae bacterium]|nr:DUF2279 domain-containing protein [Longimicrobiaceae bacterium]
MNPAALLLVFSFSGAPTAPDAWLAEDKFKHFFASFVVTSLAASAANTAGMDSDESVLVGVGVGTSVGVWKELRDRGAETETASFKDLVWDLGGVGAAAAVMSQVR